MTETPVLLKEEGTDNVVTLDQIISPPPELIGGIPSSDSTTTHKVYSNSNETAGSYQKEQNDISVSGTYSTKESYIVDQEVTTTVRRKRRKDLTTTTATSPIINIPIKETSKPIYDGKIVKPRSVPIPNTCPHPNNDKDAIKKQKKLLTRIRIPKLLPQSHILVTCKYVISQLKEKYPELSNTLSHTVETKDLLSLIPSQQDLINIYKELSESKSKTTVLNSILEIIAFTARFPSSKFIPRDASVMAEEASSKTESQSNELHEISLSLRTDYIDRAVRDHLSSYLMANASLACQKLRWILLNIQEDRILDEDENPLSSNPVERSIEIPDLTEEEMKPSEEFYLQDPHEVIHKCSEATKTILNIFKEQGSDEYESWANYFIPLNTLFSSLDENYSPQQLISNASLITRTSANISTFSTTCSKISDDLTQPVNDLHTDVNFLSDFLLYCEQDELTTESISEGINIAYIDTTAEEEDKSKKPDEVSRLSIIDYTLIKTKAAIQTPGASTRGARELAEAYFVIQKTVKTSVLYSDLGIIKWDLENIDLNSWRVKSVFNDVSESVSNLSATLSVNDGEFYEKWSIYFNSFTFSSPSEFNNKTLRDRLIEMRETMDPVYQYRLQLNIDKEAEDAATVIERSIDLLDNDIAQVEGRDPSPYTIESKPPVENIMKTFPPEHVSKTIQPSEKAETEKPSISKQLPKKEVILENLYPRHIKRVTYASWQADKFAEAATAAVQPPSDLQVNRPDMSGKIKRGIHGYGKISMNSLSHANKSPHRSIQLEGSNLLSGSSPGFSLDTDFNIYRPLPIEEMIALQSGTPDNIEPILQNAKKYSSELHQHNKEEKNSLFYEIEYIETIGQGLLNSHFNIPVETRQKINDLIGVKEDDENYEYAYSQVQANEDIEKQRIDLLAQSVSEQDRNDYNMITQEVCALIDSFTEISDFQMPKDALQKLIQYLRAEISLLISYENTMAEGTELNMAEKWQKYLEDTHKTLRSICAADDEVTIVLCHEAFNSIRTAFSSFSQEAETLDRQKHRIGLTVLNNRVIRMTDTILKFDHSIQYMELCTIPDARAQLEELNNSFQNADSPSPDQEIEKESEKRVKISSPPHKKSHQNANKGMTLPLPGMKPTVDVRPRRHERKVQKVQFSQEKIDLKHEAVNAELIIHEVLEMLNNNDFNTSNADDASQRLVLVQKPLYLKISSEYDITYSLFLKTVTVRTSLINLHVSDASPEETLIQDTQNIVNGIERLTDALSAPQFSEQRSQLAKQWVKFLTSVQEDIKGLEDSSAIVSRSSLRFKEIARYLQSVQNSMLPLSSPKFPLSVKPYPNLSNSIEKCIDYCNFEASNLSRANQISTSRKSAKSIRGFSVLNNIFQIPKAQKNNLDEYANGFVDSSNQKVKDLRNRMAALPTESITERAVKITAMPESQSNEKEESIPMKVELARVETQDIMIATVQKLVNAHFEAFTRQFQIDETSTRLCTELLLEFSASIAETSRVQQNLRTAEESQDNVKSLPRLEQPHAIKEARMNLRSEILNLNECVERHATQISGIQAQYDDRRVYSDFGRSRLDLMLKLCSSVGQISLMNAHSLVQAEERFDFKQLNHAISGMQQICQDLPKKIDASSLLNSINLLKTKSIELENDQSSILTLIDLEAPVATQIAELVNALNAEPDVRLYKISDPSSFPPSIIPETLRSSNYTRTVTTTITSIIESRTIVEKTISTSKTSQQPSKQNEEEVMFDELKREIDLVTDQTTKIRGILQSGNAEEKVIVEEIQAVDRSVSEFCKDAATNPAIFNGDMQQLIARFGQEIATFVNHVRAQLIAGTYVIDSYETSTLLRQVSSLAAEVSSQLTLLEQMGDLDSMLTLLSRLAKLLMLARDDLKQAAEKYSWKAFPPLAQTAGASYEVIANVLLTIKNSPASTTKRLLKERVWQLRSLVFHTQQLLNASAFLHITAVAHAGDPVESAETLVKAAMADVISSLEDVNTAVPEIMMKCGKLQAVVSALSTRLTILIEPLAENRTFFKKE